jgi:hypothetical protein
MAAGAIGLALFAYRTTVPPVARWLRLTLAGLRATALFLLFTLLAEPLLSLITRTILDPVVVLLVDNSRSLTMSDRIGSREKTVHNLLSSPTFGRMKRERHLLFSSFGDRTKFYQSYSPDSLTFAAEATDIARAFEEIKKREASNIQAVVLISDGNSTTGSSPFFAAQEMGIPCFTIGIGDTAEQKDVLIRKIAANAITYVGERTPINVSVKSSGYSNGRVSMKLSEGNEILDTASFSLNGGLRDYNLTLHYAPSREGLHRLSVELSHLPQELTYANNRSSVVIKVLKSKNNVLIVSGPPSPDAGFVRRSLSANRNFNVLVRTERTNGDFYEGSLSHSFLDTMDCIVLVGYPSINSRQSDISEILSAAQRGKGIMFIASRAISYERLATLEPVLPFTVGRRGIDEFSVFAVIPPHQRTHALLRLTGGINPVEAWSKLPPVFRTQVVFRAKPEAEVIAQSRVQSTVIDDPFILARNVNKLKSIAITAYGLWRWKAYSQNIAGTQTLAEDFFSNAVRWLTVKEDDRKVRVAPEKESFGNQEQVAFTAQVYDDSYEPVDDAVITITSEHQGRQQELTLSSIGNGQYEGAFDPMEEGDYDYHVVVSRDGKILLNERGRFAVGGLSAEFIETNMNQTLLMQIASRTGAKYYPPDRVETLPQDIGALPNFKTRTITHADEIKLWHEKWSLIALILCFSLEWIIRKRMGMV